jgi:hypothetical protein
MNSYFTITGQLVRCGTCGAAVPRNASGEHDAWHASLEASIREASRPEPPE